MKGCYTYEGVCAHVHLFQNGENQQIQDRMNLWLHATYSSKEERPLPEFLTAMPGDDVIIIQDWAEMLGDDVAVAATATALSFAWLFLPLFFFPLLLASGMFKGALGPLGCVCGC